MPAFDPPGIRVPVLAMVEVPIAPTSFVSQARLRDLALPLASRSASVDLDHSHHKATVHDPAAVVVAEEQLRANAGA